MLKKLLKPIVLVFCCFILLVQCACKTHSEYNETQSLENARTDLFELPLEMNEEITQVPRMLPEVERAGIQSQQYSTSPYSAGSLEEAAWLYVRFLRSEIPGYDKDGYVMWLGDFYFRCVDDNSLNSYSIKDLTGDGIPELFTGRGDEIWTIENGRVVCLLSHTHSWWTLLPIGAMCYYRPGGDHAEFFYRSISDKSKQYPDIDLAVTYSSTDDKMDRYMINGEEVSRETWDEVSSIYFALRDAEPEDNENEVVFSDWLKSLDDFELPPKVSIDVTIIESDGHYCVVATDFGNPAAPDRAYTLVLYDRHGYPIQTVGYGQHYPNIHYVSEYILQVSYHVGSGLVYEWFFDILSDILSPIYIDRLFVMDRTLVYFSYDRDYNDIVLKVSDMFDPELYTETFELFVPPVPPFENALKDAINKGRELEITYLGDDDQILTHAEFALGDNSNSAGS